MNPPRSRSSRLTRRTCARAGLPRHLHARYPQPRHRVPSPRPRSPPRTSRLAANAGSAPATPCEAHDPPPPPPFCSTPPDRPRQMRLHRPPRRHPRHIRAQRQRRRLHIPLPRSRRTDGVPDVPGLPLPHGARPCVGISPLLGARQVQLECPPRSRTGWPSPPPGRSPSAAPSHKRTRRNYSSAPPRTSSAPCPFLLQQWNRVSPRSRYPGQRDPAPPA